MSREEENTAIVRRVMEEVFGQGNLDLANELIAPTFINHDAPRQAPGPKGVERVARIVRTALGDFTVTIEHLLSQGDLVTMSCSVQGIHQAPLLGVAATGKHVEFRIIDIYRVEQGQLVEMWGVPNFFGLLQQLKGELLVDGKGWR